MSDLTTTTTTTALDPVEARVLDLVDDAAALSSLLALMAVPSIGGTDGEVQIQHVLAGRLDELGLATDLWPLDLPALAAAPGFPGVEVERSGAWGLVGQSRPGESAALVLQGHVDVVPPGDRTAWRSDPFVPELTGGTGLAGGTVVGRGACDMKAGIAAILAAVAALRRSGVALERGYAVHLCVGEEDGGLGAFATLARGHRGEACVIGEPTSLQLVTASAGALTFRLEVPGRATHGSTAYAGSSAIDSYLGVHAALHRLSARRNRDPEPSMSGYPVAYPLSVGRLRSGDWASSVPDLLVAEGRYGLRVEEDPASARAELEEAVREASAADPYLRDHPVLVTWPGGQFAGGRLPSGHPLAAEIAAAHGAVTGRVPGGELGVPYGSDQRLYAGQGVPTLLYGPGDVRLAHSPRESVPVAEVLVAARVLALAVLRACR